MGTQATLTQAHFVNGEKSWRPVNHTSRVWTAAEAGYGQIERESNGILSGMLMNKMYALGTHVEVVCDHEPLIHIYNSTQKPKQLRVNSHRTKLLPFNYNVVYEPGKTHPVIMVLVIHLVKLLLRPRLKSGMLMKARTST